MIRVFAIHTAMALVEPITQLFKENLPDVKLNHLADDSLIQEVIANNRVTPAVRRRMFSYYHNAVDAGADIIFNTCSSIGEVAQMARLFLPIPIIKIDDYMAEKAVEKGKRIGVLATLPTTLEPTANLIREKAREKNISVDIVEGLADGAFQAVMSGDRETHDKLILKASERVAEKADVIVLAQGSMARMEKQLADVTGKIVLSSPLLGVLSVKEYIRLQNLK